MPRYLTTVAHRVWMTLIPRDHHNGLPGKVSVHKGQMINVVTVNVHTYPLMVYLLMVNSPILECIIKNGT